MNGVKEMIGKVKEKLNQEIGIFSKELETLTEFNQQFDALAANYECRRKLKTSLKKYKVGTLFLKECAEYLNSSPNEVLHLVTGLEMGKDFYLMDKVEKIKFQANPVGAKAEMSDLSLKLIEMDETYGHLLLGVFHSHPFEGATGTQPSGTDRRLQETLEHSGYEAIQAIFSRDGYLRFFSNQLNFEIEIYGKGVEKIEKGDEEHEKIYRLVNFQKREPK